MFFLFGMNVSETGLKNISQKKLSSKLNSAKINPITSVLLGVLITAVLQSSSAVTVMLIGAINAGLIRLKRAVYIVMGANIGTSVTAWIVSLSGIENRINPISLYPIVGLVGIGFIILSKNINRVSVGMALVGFTLIMSGMNGMSSAVEPLSNSGGFTRFMTEFENPLLGIVLGAITTAVMQSSSAAVGILQALSSTIGLSLITAVPIILGQNIGTCITAWIASVGSSKNAKHLAAFHLGFNIIGVLMWTIVFYIVRGFLPDISIKPVDIAIIHTLFNVSSTLIVLSLQWSVSSFFQNKKRIISIV